MASHYGHIYGGYVAGNSIYGHGGFVNQTQAMQMAGGPAGYPSPQQGPQVNNPLMIANSGPLLLGHHVNCTQAGISMAGSRCPLCGGLDPRDIRLYSRLLDDCSTVNAPLGYVSGAVAGMQWAPHLAEGWPRGGGRVNGAVAPVGSVGALPAPGALASAHFFFR